MEPDSDYQALHEADLQFCERLTSLVEIIGILSQSGSVESFFTQAQQLARERLGFETIALRLREEKVLGRKGDSHESGTEQGSTDSRRTRRKESPTVAVSPIFDGEKPIGQVRTENRRSRKPITRQQREILRLFALALGCQYTRMRIEAEREQIIRDLQAAIARINTLHGLLPICCSCKKIRQDDGYWSQIEEYLQAHSDATFSHGICPDCTRKLYPEVYEHQRRKRESGALLNHTESLSDEEAVPVSTPDEGEDSAEETGSD